MTMTGMMSIRNNWNECFQRSGAAAARPRPVIRHRREKSRGACFTVSPSLDYRLASIAASWASLLAFAGGARAETADLAQSFSDHQDVFGLALSGGLALFSVVVALTHISERTNWRKREAELAAQVAQTSAKLDRAETFIACEPQIFIAWDGPDSEPDIAGAPLLVTNLLAPRRALGFGAWLAPDSARELEAKVEQLRHRGEGFRLALVGLTGRHFDAEGRAVSEHAVLRIREVSGDRLELIGLRERHAQSAAEVECLRALLDATPAPVWIRDMDGRLTFVNTAYARAVDARTRAEAIEKQIELLDQPAREAAAQARAKSQPWRERVTAVVAGARHLLEVTQAPAAGLTGAMAIDRQEIETVRVDLERQMCSHVRTLDQLPTAVAIFDRSQQLIYRNAAYNDLWRLDPDFLDQRPKDAEILDRLRLEQRLPVDLDEWRRPKADKRPAPHEDYRAWKSRLLDAYRSLESQEYVWRTPDGRMLRVVVHPNPQGGVTYLYDDLSDQYKLEWRFHTLDRMQNETLETLREGVVVFGADGLLKFANPAFVKLWRLDPKLLEPKPREQKLRFDEIADLCHALHPNEATWSDLRGFVTGLDDMRTGFTRRIERSDGVWLDLTAQPLPEGAALLTFVDVTADVNVGRNLTDSNDALRAAEKLRNDFIHHISYELRSPLNNINGFVHLLGQETTGALNERQLEYLGYVSKSSAALLAIIDDILDLATIDENVMALDWEDVDAQSALRAALEGVQDRLADMKIELQIVAPQDVGTFRGDAKRVRQILFNLLSNAIGFSREGQTVTLAALRRDTEVVFKVIDHGRGIPPEIVERVFERFESHTAGSRHRGVGLGLSIVRALVEMHGGKVLIDSALGEGTTVTCIFPALASVSERALHAPEGERAS